MFQLFYLRQGYLCWSHWCSRDWIQRQWCSCLYWLCYGWDRDRSGHLLGFSISWRQSREHLNRWCCCLLLHRERCKYRRHLRELWEQRHSGWGLDRQRRCWGGLVRRLRGKLRFWCWLLSGCCRLGRQGVFHFCGDRRARHCRYDWGRLLCFPLQSLNITKQTVSLSFPINSLWICLFKII